MPAKATIRVSVRVLLAAGTALWLAACSSPGPTDRRAEAPSKSGNPESYVVFGKRYQVLGTSEGYRERGIASWYGDAFHGKKTSSGVPFDMHEISAAHKTLPIPTWVKVTNLRNGKSLVLRVNDRGPFVGDRVIDLSFAAAKELEVTGRGTAEVELEAVAPFQTLADAWRRPKPGDAGTLLASRDRGSADTLAAAAGSTRALPWRPPAAVTPAPAGNEPWRPSEAPVIAAATEAVPAAIDPPAETVPRPAEVSAALPLPADATVQPPVARLERRPPPADFRTPAGPPTSVRPAALAPQPLALATAGTTSSGVFLQLGAFGDRRNAEALKTRIAGRFAQPVTIDGSRNDGLLRVKIGPFQTEPEAERASLMVASLGLGRPRMVID